MEPSLDAILQDIRDEGARFESRQNSIISTKNQISESDSGYKDGSVNSTNSNSTSNNNNHLHSSSFDRQELFNNILDDKTFTGNHGHSLDDIDISIVSGKFLENSDGNHSPTLDIDGIFGELKNEIKQENNSSVNNNHSNDNVINQQNLANNQSITIKSESQTQNSQPNNFYFQNTQNNGPTPVRGQAPGNNNLIRPTPNYTTTHQQTAHVAAMSARAAAAQMYNPVHMYGHHHPMFGAHHPMSAFAAHQNMQYFMAAQQHSRNMMVRQGQGQTQGQRIVGPGQLMTQNSVPVTNNSRVVYPPGANINRSNSQPTKNETNKKTQKTRKKGTTEKKKK